MNVFIRRALLSVWDKSGLVPLASCLARFGTQLYSTGKTASLLREAGLTVHDVSALTQRPEAFGGRMKTISYEISSALLFQRDKDAEEAERLGITAIDMVVANLYPFEEYRDRDLNLQELIEFVDIGGPTMVRAAAKNFQDVASVVRPADYPALIEELQATGGALSLATRRQLMQTAFRTTANYDASIAAHLEAQSEQGAQSSGALNTTLRFGPPQPLRYGENPHQKAAIHAKLGAASPTDALRAGKELSYNNLLDVEAALAAVRGHGPHACAIVKHGNSCGLATGDNLAQALEAAWASDPISAFGSVIAFGGRVTGSDLAPLRLDAADKNSRRFVEVVVAPAFDSEALEYLQTSKNLRVLELDADTAFGDSDNRICLGHLLTQDADHQLHGELRVATSAPHVVDAELARFGLRAARAIKSNAIAIVARRGSNFQLLGMGAGQPNRVASARLAAERALATLTAEQGTTSALVGEVLAQAYAVSDAFLPFADTLEVLVGAGVQVLLQPGGSIRDGDVVARANQLGATVVMTETRHFRH
jgi:phosphoribosylaminoimidazolecarboxamide formyltransferase / IMP cyclohydrolase